MVSTTDIEYWLIGCIQKLLKPVSIHLGYIWTTLFVCCGMLNTNYWFVIPVEMGKVKIREGSKNDSIDVRQWMICEDRGVSGCL